MTEMGRADQWRRSIGLAAFAVVVAFVVPMAMVAADDGGAPPAGVPAPAAGGAASAAPRKPQGANVRIVFTVLPSSKKATVSWGKKRLGVIGPQAPLIVQRPRDSGPLDVVVRAEGCLPVQTRAYTFEDSKVAVKVTPLDQKNTLLGYREEVPAESSSNPDGGAFFSR
jgi:hypothetical protein